MKPLFKVAGGKRELAPKILKFFPDKFELYAEPTLGAGAVFYAAEESKMLFQKGVVLSDISDDVMIIWNALVDDPIALATELDDLVREHEASATPRLVFETIRAAWNSKTRRTAAVNLYLRYACFNGLWRVSKAGSFNAPWNKESTVAAPKSDAIFAASALLEKASLFTRSAFDFEFETGAVVYLDPPYDSEATPATATKKAKKPGFTAYTPGGFGDADQIKLIECAARWSNAGATVIYSNAATSSVRTWLKEYWPHSAIYAVDNTRTIAADSNLRGTVKELLVVGGPV